MAAYAPPQAGEVENITAPSFSPRREIDQGLIGRGIEPENRASLAKLLFNKILATRPERPPCRRASRQPQEFRWAVITIRMRSAALRAPSFFMMLAR